MWSQFWLSGVIYHQNPQLVMLNLIYHGDITILGNLNGGDI